MASGARPPLFATWMLFVSKGDKTISFFFLLGTTDIMHICLEQITDLSLPLQKIISSCPRAIEPYLSEVKLIAINSPLNPTGTVISEEALRGICEAIVEGK